VLCSLSCHGESRRCTAETHPAHNPTPTTAPASNGVVDRSPTLRRPRCEAQAVRLSSAKSGGSVSSRPAFSPRASARPVAVSTGPRSQALRPTTGMLCWRTRGRSVSRSVRTNTEFAPVTVPSPIRATELSGRTRSLPYPLQHVQAAGLDARQLPFPNTSRPVHSGATAFVAIHRRASARTARSYLTDEAIRGWWRHSCSALPDEHGSAAIHGRGSRPSAPRSCRRRSGRSRRPIVRPADRWVAGRASGRCWCRAASTGSRPDLPRRPDRRR